ncbi:hypothetical protein JET66_03855 [Pseudomonas putida]|uniref:hypothetical protein n=1 Tax=Pseudomonas putida TaxID=303 RepID=UPI0018E6C759|nr:hypothetical protein [Pseudomonas putida]MBI6923788.1 hypothetical protein [Pseudomonas putida]
MIEQFSVNELEAILKGVKPSDLPGGETIAQYLHRGIQRLATELNKAREDRDALLEAGAHLL